MHMHMPQAHAAHLVEDDPLDLAHDLRAAVEHRAENLGGHHEARGVDVDGHVARHQPHVAKLLLELAVLLIRERLRAERAPGRGMSGA